MEEERHQNEPLKKPEPPENQDPCEQIFDEDDFTHVDIPHDPDISGGHFQKYLLERMNKGFSKFAAQIDAVAEEIKTLKTAEQLVTELGENNRLLSKDFYERHVLLPVIKVQIDIVNSCRDQVKKWRHVLEKYNNHSNEAAKKLISQLIRAREAELVELENRLGDLGVEIFEHPQNIFDPSMQTCIEKIKSEDQSRHGHICRRLRPGYKRGGRVIQPECVSVYVSR